MNLSHWMRLALKQMISTLKIDETVIHKTGHAITKILTVTIY